MDRRSFMRKSAMAIPWAAGGAVALGATSAKSTEVSDSSDTQKTFQMTQTIPVEEGYDVAIAGGGPAGVAAAVCAARLGHALWDPRAQGLEEPVDGRTMCQRRYHRARLPALPALLLADGPGGRHGGSAGDRVQGNCRHTEHGAAGAHAARAGCLFATEGPEQQNYQGVKPC